MQDMKRRTNHEKAACTRLYASRPYHLQNMGAYKPGPDFPECPRVSQVSQPLWDGTVGQRDNSRKPIIKKVMSNYSLQKYKGTSTRHTCPNCGDRRSFAYYVDESGTPLHPSVGRCNHESGCGYIIIRPNSIFTTTPNAGPPVVSLPADNVWRRSPSNRCNRQPSVTYRHTMWRNRRACIATSAVSFQHCLIPITAARQRKCRNG